MHAPSSQLSIGVLVEIWRPRMRALEFRGKFWGGDPVLYMYLKVLIKLSTAVDAWVHVQYLNYVNLVLVSVDLPIHGFVARTKI